MSTIEAKDIPKYTGDINDTFGVTILNPTTNSLNMGLPSKLKTGGSTNSSDNTTTTTDGKVRGELLFTSATLSDPTGSSATKLGVYAAAWTVSAYASANGLKTVSTNASTDDKFEGTLIAKFGNATRKFMIFPQMALHKNHNGYIVAVEVGGTEIYNANYPIGDFSDFDKKIFVPTSKTNRNNTTLVHSFLRGAAYQNATNDARWAWALVSGAATDSGEAPDANTKIKIYEAVSAPITISRHTTATESPVDVAKDTFVATAGESITASLTSPKPVRFGTAARTEVDGGTIQNSTAITNLIAQTTGMTAANLYMSGSVHSYPPNNLVVLDIYRGCFISNDGGTTWGSVQGPESPVADADITNTQTVGFWRAWFSGTKIVIEKSKGRPESRSLNNSNVLENVWVGTINFSTRTIGSWASISAVSGDFAAQTKGYYMGFAYDSDNSNFYYIVRDSSASRSLDPSLYSLTLGASTATLTASQNAVGYGSIGSYSTLDQVISGGAIAFLRDAPTISGKTAAVILIGNKLFRAQKQTGQTPSLSLTSSTNNLPGSSSNLVNYIDAVVDPKDKTNVFFLKTTGNYNTGTPLVLESATLGFDSSGNPELSGFRTIDSWAQPNAANGSFVYYAPGCLSYSDKNLGLWVGPNRRYNVAGGEADTRFFEHTSSDTQPIVGFIQKSAETGVAQTIQYRGLMDGLSGLTSGAAYTVNSKKVGVALGSSAVVLKALPLK